MDIVRERLIELLEPRGTATLLAKYLNVHPNTVGGWKSKLSDGYSKYLPQIAEFFDVSMDWLSGMTDDRNSHRKCSFSIPHKSDTRRLIDSYLDDFDEEQLIVLLAKIKSMLDM